MICDHVKPPGLGMLWAGLHRECFGGSHEMDSESLADGLSYSFESESVGI